MRIEQDLKLDYSDVLFRPKRSTMGSRKDVDLIREFKFRNSGATYKGIPIMAANMQGVGTFDMAYALTRQSMFTCLDKTYQVVDIYDHFMDHKNRSDVINSIAVSTGITDVDQERIEKALQLMPDIKTVCIDVANGYSERFINYVARFRDAHPDVTIIAGNVVTPDITEELILRGADIVKVGIGPGSVCTTRIKTGVGYPQLSAVIECMDAAHGLGGHIIADGGCTSAGDVAKAFGAGADFVMLGGMLAGHNEGGGELVNRDGKPLKDVFGEVTNEAPRGKEKAYVQFYGSSTTQAQQATGGVQGHRTSEGRIVRIPHKGEVINTVSDVLGGIRSACTYVGADKLKNLSKCTTFVRCSQTHNSVYTRYQTGE